MPDTDAVVAAFAQRGAGAIEHPGGTLLTHLVRTGDVLRRWEAPPELVLAGVAHAAYGTDEFGVALFDVDRRDELVGLIGEPAEAIVHRYASCDRRFTLPRIAAGGDVAFRDRFTGTVDTVPAVDVRSFAELTVANELDVVTHSDSFRAEHGEALRRLFESWRGLVSDAAYAEVEQCLP